MGATGTWVRAGVLGMVAGMRAALPFAPLALAAGRGRFGRRLPWPLALIGSRWARAGIGLAAAGELVVDKLPVTPSRLRPGPLGGRLICGGLAGGLVARDAGRPWPVGATIGAIGAAAGASLGYHTRRTLGQRTGLPDPVWGAAEDVVAFALGSLATFSAPEVPVGARSVAARTEIPGREAEAPAHPRSFEAASEALVATWPPLEEPVPG